MDDKEGKIPISLFISYAREERSLLEEVFNTLKWFLKISSTYDYSIFIDYKNVESGDEWEKEILDKLDSSDIVLLFTSPTYFGKEFIREKELKYITFSNKDHIPIGFKYIDLTSDRLDLSGINNKQFYKFNDKFYSQCLGSEKEDFIHGLFDIIEKKADKSIKSKHRKKQSSLYEDCAEQRIKPFSFLELLNILVISLGSHHKTAASLNIDEFELQYYLSSDSLESTWKNVERKLHHEIYKQTDGIKATELHLKYMMIDNKEVRNACALVIQGFFASEDMINFIKNHVPSKAKLANSQLRKIYVQSAISISPTEMGMFARGSFAKELWRKIINTPQYVNEPKNHLHYSNLLIAEHFRDTLFGKTKMPARLRILEGGVGGGNTISTIIELLYEKWCSTTNSMSNQRYVEQPLIIEYLGYDINPSFVAKVKDIINGTADSTQDPRINLFKKIKLTNKDKIIPWQRKDDILKAQDMSDGIAELVINTDYHNKMHLFVCSYAFHHVANGQTLREYLFGSKFSDIIIPDYKKVSAEIDEVWSILTSGNKYKSKSRLATKLAEYLIKTDENIISEIKSYFYIEEHKGKSKIAKDLAEQFHDFQFEMLNNIWTLLMPGGVIAIADPDGFSEFNKKNVPNDPEMSVAHFRNIKDMELLVTSAGFCDVKTYTIAEQKSDNPSNKYIAFNEKMQLRNLSIIDPNLGYIILAKKPYREDVYRKGVEEWK